MNLQLVAVLCVSFAFSMGQREAATLCGDVRVTVFLARTFGAITKAEHTKSNKERASGVNLQLFAILCESYTYSTTNYQLVLCMHYRWLSLRSLRSARDVSYDVALSII